MKNNFIKIVLVCILLFFSSSCSSEEDTDSGGVGNGGIDISDNRKSTGSSANDLLSNTTFKKMIIELGYIEGFEPTQAAQINFRNFIESRTLVEVAIVEEVGYGKKNYKFFQTN